MGHKEAVHGLTLFFGAMLACVMHLSHSSHSSLTRASVLGVGHACCMCHCCESFSYMAPAHCDLQHGIQPSSQKVMAIDVVSWGYNRP